MKLDITTRKAYGNLNISIWSMQQKYIHDNVVLLSEYDHENLLYKFTWTCCNKKTYSRIKSIKLDYSELKLLIVETFMREFVDEKY